MVRVRNVFLKYGSGAKRLSEIWFGCKLTMGREVCVPFQTDVPQQHTGGAAQCELEPRGVLVRPHYDVTWRDKYPWLQRFSHCWHNDG